MHQYMYAFDNILSSKSINQADGQFAGKNFVKAQNICSRPITSKEEGRYEKGEGQMDGKGQECIRKMSEMAVCQYG